MLRRDKGEPWFFTYNHDIEHPYFAERENMVRFHVLNQGLVAQPHQVQSKGETQKRTRLTWLVNTDFGGSIPSAFALSILVSMMDLPVSVVADARVHAMTSLLDAETKKRKDGNASMPKVEDENGDTYWATMPEDLAIEDCLIDPAKHATLKLQREHHGKEMLAMADDDEGWALLCKTEMVDVPPQDQMEVWEKKFDWSAGKVLRSTETTDASCVGRCTCDVCSGSNICSDRTTHLFSICDSPNRRGSSTCSSLSFQWARLSVAASTTKTCSAGVNARR